MSLQVVVGILAAALTMVFAWPQAIRVLRARDVHGVAPATALLVLFTAVSWTIFGLLIWDGPMIIANWFAMISASITLGVLLKRGRFTGGRLIGAVVLYVVVLLLALALLGEDGPGWMGVVAGIGMAIPQTVRVMRGDSAGVSIAMYLLMSAMMASWLVYGLLIGEFVAVIANVLALPAALLCASRLIVERLRQKPAVVTPASAADVT